MKNAHLLVKFSSNRIPSIKEEKNFSCQYDPKTQMTEYLMGGPSTSCHRVTNGTQPKNEADRIMDDN